MAKRRTNKGFWWRIGFHRLVLLPLFNWHTPHGQKVVNPNLMDPAFQGKGLARTVSVRNGFLKKQEPGDRVVGREYNDKPHRFYRQQAFMMKANGKWIQM